nr:heme-binding protein [Ktedonobacteraceae bacterium]
VMFNQSTDAVAQWGAGIPGFASSLATMTHGKFIMAAGGWPIKVNGATVGGIGVSGGNAPGRDDEIARAGLGSLEAYAPPIPAQPPRLAQPVPPMQPQASPPVNSQQYSRPYMQPSASYPAMPPANNANAPTPLSNSSSSAPSQPNGGSQATPPSGSNVEQQSNAPLGTHYLYPEQQQQQEEYPYNDANSQFNDNRSGGQ